MNAEQVQNSHIHMVRKPNPHRVPRHNVKMHPLARQFFEIMQGQGVALTDVAERAGVCHTTIVKWRYLHTPRADVLEAALNALGYRLQIVEIVRPPENG